MRMNIRSGAGQPIASDVVSMRARTMAPTATLTPPPASSRPICR
jgi:hypothetical protein